MVAVRFTFSHRQREYFFFPLMATESAMLLTILPERVIHLNLVTSMKYTYLVITLNMCSMLADLIEHVFARSDSH